MSRPKLLDLFCGAGGAAAGYHRAGFDVVGVDINPQPNYPYRFIQADALLYLEYMGSFYDAIHASPPCQDHSSLRTARASGHGTGWLLPATLAALAKLPAWVVENVEGADMPGAFRLCGSSFGLGSECRDGQWRQLRRHRLFLSSAFVLAPECQHRGYSLGVYGTGVGGSKANGRRGAYQGHREERSRAMDIDWMTQKELAQAIPPAYTEHIGAQLIAQLEERAA